MLVEMLNRNTITIDMGDPNGVDEQRNVLHYEPVEHVPVLVEAIRTAMVASSDYLYVKTWHDYQLVILREDGEQFIQDLNAAALQAKEHGETQDRLQKSIAQFVREGKNINAIKATRELSHHMTGETMSLRLGKYMVETMILLRYG